MKEIIDKCKNIETCATKETLFKLLNITDNKTISNEMRFMMAIKAIDELFKGPSNSEHHKKFKIRFIGDTVQGNRYVVENNAHIYLKDELQLTCLKTINKLYYNELLQDQNTHPAILFKKSNTQHYDERTEQMHYSNQLDLILSNLKNVLTRQSQCDVNPSEIFTELCTINPNEHRFNNDILTEICMRVMKIFHKKEANGFTLMELWNFNHTDRVLAEFKAT